MLGRPQPAATGVSRKAYGRRDGSALGGGSLASSCGGEGSAVGGGAAALATSAGDGGSRLVEPLSAACRLASAGGRGLAGRFVERRVASEGACAGAGQQVTTKENGLSCFALSLAGPSVRVVPTASRTHSPLVSFDVLVVPVAPDDANVPFMPSDRASNSSPLTARSSRWQPDTTWWWSSGSECVRGSSPAACSFSARPRHMKPPSATSLVRTPAESLTVEVSTNMGFAEVDKRGFATG